MKYTLQIGRIHINISNHSKMKAHPILRKAWMMMILSLYTLFSNAQLDINFHPAGNLILSGQIDLSMFSIHSGSKTNELVNIEIRVFDQAGMLAIQQNLTNVRLAAHTINNLRNIQSPGLMESHIHSDYAHFIQASSCLPKGIYSVQIQVQSVRKSLIHLEKEFKYRQTANCNVILRLKHPPDLSKIPQSSEVYSWISNLMMPNGLLEYEMQVFAIKNGQSKENAVLTNRAILTRKSATLSTQIFSTLSSLSKASRFAWHVVAKWEDREIARSEIWELLADGSSPLVEEKYSEIPSNSQSIYFRAGDPFHPPSYSSTSKTVHYYFRSLDPGEDYMVQITGPTGREISREGIQCRAGINYKKIQIREAEKSNVSHGNYTLTILRNQIPLKSLIVQIQ